MKLSSFTERSAREELLDFQKSPLTLSLTPTSLCCESKTRNLRGQLVARLGKFLEVKSHHLKVSFPLKG